MDPFGRAIAPNTLPSQSYGKVKGQEIQPISTRMDPLGYFAKLDVQTYHWVPGDAPAALSPLIGRSAGDGKVDAGIMAGTPVYPGFNHSTCCANATSPCCRYLPERPSRDLACSDAPSQSSSHTPHPTRSGAAAHYAAQFMPVPTLCNILPQMSQARCPHRSAKAASLRRRDSSGAAVRGRASARMQWAGPADSRQADCMYAVKRAVCAYHFWECDASRPDQVRHPQPAGSRHYNRCLGSPPAVAHWQPGTSTRPHNRSGRTESAAGLGRRAFTPIP